MILGPWKDVVGGDEVHLRAVCCGEGSSRTAEPASHACDARLQREGTAKAKKWLLCRNT